MATIHVLPLSREAWERAPGWMRPWAVGMVVLCDGKRVSWKTHRGAWPETMGRWLHWYDLCGLDEAQCEVKTQRFDDPGAFEAAEQWAKSFPTHPNEGRKSTA